MRARSTSPPHSRGFPPGFVFDTVPPTPESMPDRPTPRSLESPLRSVGWIVVWFIGSAVSGGRVAAVEEVASAALPTFFGEHCEQCHGGRKPKGGFAIAGLSSDFSDPDHHGRWLEVLDHLEAGSMPPEDEEQPGAAERETAMEWIRDRAARAEEERRAAEGRVVMRRLNRAEYANTVRDLLGVEVDLADLLPPDTSTNGFDNNAANLHTSSYLLHSYLEAADRVLDEAIANEPRPWLLKRRYDLKEERSVRPKGSVYRHLDDGVAIFAVWESANIRVTMWNFRSHVRGRYRFRISAYGYQSEGKPVRFRVTAGTLKEVTEERLVDYFSVPADKPTVIEFTEHLEPENRLRIIAEGLPVTPPQVEKVGAENYTGPGLVVQWVEAEGPLLESWPPPSHRALFGDLKQERVAGEGDRARHEVVSTQPVADAERILRDFAGRAFRRPVDDEAIRPFLERVRSRLDEGYRFEEAVRVGLKAVLTSPEFLFLREEVKPGATGLDDFAVASRLSYFLWSSMPDKTLIDLAAAGRLRDPEVLRGQVERLLDDPKAAAFTELFTGQWLGLRAIDETSPDRLLYPEYDDLLKVAMVKETTMFFDEVLKNDLSVANFVDSDFTFLNARLAQHYGIPGIEGLEMRKVTLPPDSPRGGVMTMGSVLKVTANGTTTSPVLRGAWILERLLGAAPPPPPEDVAAIEPDIRGATTIREQLAKHRDTPACASCHRKIDPPGFALENFDVIGGWREHYRATGEPREINGRRVRFWDGPVVEPGDVLPDGRRFDDIHGYKRLLLEDKDPLARALAEKLIAYATGASPGLAERAEVEAIVSRIREKDHGFRSLVHEVVQSPVFLNK